MSGVVFKGEVFGPFSCLQNVLDSDFLFVHLMRSSLISRGSSIYLVKTPQTTRYNIPVQVENKLIIILFPAKGSSCMSIFLCTYTPALGKWHVRGPFSIKLALSRLLKCCWCFFHRFLGRVNYVDRNFEGHFKNISQPQWALDPVKTLVSEHCF